MKKVLLVAAGVILSLFIFANVASALSPSIAEAIQGLPFGDQLSLLAQKVDEQEEKIDNQGNQIESLEQQLEAEKAKNATLEGQLEVTNQKVEQTTKNIECDKVSDLAEGLPNGMPVKHSDNPAESSIKGYLDFYIDQVSQLESKNLPAETKFGNWTKSNGEKATLSEIKTAVSYLETKYNEYLILKQGC